MRINICERCGKAYRTYPSKQGRSRFCSRVCQNGGPLPVRFWARVRRSADCWEWQGAIDHKWGYGQISVAGKMQLAHRIAYKLAYGSLPDDLLVCHKCDNPRCVRPDHLFLGTSTDNAHDKVRKGRQADHHGEKNPHAKLTSEQVQAIRTRFAQGGIRPIELARQYGVTNTTISMIVRGQTWTG